MLMRDPMHDDDPAPTSANDYGRLGVFRPQTEHDYTAIMEYCKDERNWFKRARGEWDEHDPEGEDPSQR